MRKIYLIRHALSAANDETNPAFGRPDADLLYPQCLFQIGRLHKELTRNHNILIDHKTPVATSQFKRTQATAFNLGFRKCTSYELLNEYTPIDGDMDKCITDMMAGNIPEPLLKRAKQLIETDIVKENIWFTHGLVISAIMSLLNIKREDGRLCPVFCEPTIIEI